MKKLISLVLVAAMFFTMSATAFATSTPTQGFSAPSETTREGIIGTIVIEETCDVTTDVKTRSTSTSGTSTVSFVENVDGSFTVYQYINDVLTDEHTTIPGSGIVAHKYYNADGSISAKTENVSATQPPVLTTRTDIPDSVSFRDMGVYALQSHFYRYNLFHFHYHS